MLLGRSLTSASSFSTCTRLQISPQIAAVKSLNLHNQPLVATGVPLWVCGWDTRASNLQSMARYHCSWHLHPALLCRAHEVAANASMYLGHDVGRVLH